MGVPISQLRGLIAMLDVWPDALMPASHRDQRRLALLVSEVLGQDLGVRADRSHATVELDPQLPASGPIISPLGVRRNA
jgi:hypothetical protein